MSNSRKEIKITPEDIKTIYGKDYSLFEEKIIPNCYCGNCEDSYSSTIISYEIFLNDLNDITLRGSCRRCNGPVNRYLETGEAEKYQESITEVRKRLKG